MQRKRKANVIEMQHTPSEHLQTDLLTSLREGVRFNLLKEKIAVENIPLAGTTALAVGDNPGGV